MIYFLVAAIIFCTVFLIKQRREEKSQKIWQICWVVTAAVWAIYSVFTDTSQWDYTTTTHWAVQGVRVTGSGEHFFIALIGQMVFILIPSYLAARILNYFIRNTAAKFHRSPLENGEKRRRGALFRPVCYCCNQRKTNYPSRICGEHICRDCLNELGFDKYFDGKTQVAAFEGKPPFLTADDVLGELKARKAAAETGSN